MDRWGGSLQAVGGIFQPPKCTWTAHNIVQDKKGECVYMDTPKMKTKGDKEADEEEENDELDELEMIAPQLSGNTKSIQLLKSSEAVKKLGLFSRPDRCSDRHMLQMRDRMEDWTKRVKNGALPIYSV